MRIKLLVLTMFCVLIGTIGYAQTNTYDKQEVMESVKNLSDQTQTWIGNNFDRLNNVQVQSFMNRSAVSGLTKKYSSAMDQLKARATSSEIEGFYKAPSESALQALFTKHNVSF